MNAAATTVEIPREELYELVVDTEAIYWFIDDLLSYDVDDDLRAPLAVLTRIDEIREKIFAHLGGMDDRGDFPDGDDLDERGIKKAREWERRDSESIARGLMMKIAGDIDLFPQARKAAPAGVASS